MKSLKMKRLLPWLFVPVLVCFMIYRSSLIPIDSDYANLILEANEIVKGNFFLSGWNLTGISFITTDMLYFVVGALFGGVTRLTYDIAVGLMVAAAVVLGLMACEPGKRRAGSILFYCLICAVPCSFAMSVLRAHTGAVCWVFLVLVMLNREIDRHSRANGAIALAALTMACIGDSVTLIIGCMPLMLYGLQRFLIAENAGERRRAVEYILLGVVALVLGTALDRLYFVIGGANKNSFLSGKRFEPLENWGNKAEIYFRSLLMIADADFFGEKIIGIKTIAYLVNTLLIVVGLALVIHNILRFAKGKPTDFICVVLSMGILLISVIFVITDISVNVVSSRYLAYLLIAFCILIVREWDDLLAPMKDSRTLVSALIVAMALGSFAFRAMEVKATDRHAVNGDARGLCDFLEENHLTNGYSSFINASMTTALSGNSVKVRAIISDGMKVDFYNWFCKSEWYDEPANYVIATEGDDRFGIKPENIIRCFGEPQKTLEYDGKTILVYDRDLSNRLQINALKDGMVEPREMYGNDRAAFEDNAIVMEPGAVLYGPYGTLDAGTYRLVYRGDNLDALAIDAFSAKEGGLPMEAVNVGETEMEYRLTVPRLVQDIELREFNNSSETITFAGITVEH